MTEQGEKWSTEQFMLAFNRADWSSGSAYQAGFWINAFCDEVEKRYNKICPHSIMPQCT